jgi:hypothetical protein
MIYDCVILYGPNDCTIINNCIDNAKENLINIGNIYVISYDKDFYNKNFITIYEKDFPFTYEDVNSYIKSDRAGWYLQQLLKLYTPYVIKDVSEYYLILDCDTIFLNKVSMFNDENKPLYNTGSEYHVPYFAHMNKLHSSLNKTYERSGICHHMIFKKEYVDELKNLVENQHKNDFWKIILENIDHCNSRGCGFSEYETYFTYIYLNHRESFDIRDLKWKNANAIPSNSDLDYVSVHWYMKT